MQQMATTTLQEINKLANLYNKTKDDKIFDQLNKLNTLYKDGVLTKEEFEKAKKKILN